MNQAQLGAQQAQQMMQNNVQQFNNQGLMSQPAFNPEMNQM